MTETKKIRGRVREAVRKLHEIHDELTALAEGLPLPADAEEMWELRIPSTFQVNLYAALHAVCSDCIQDAAATLLDAVGQSDETLRCRFLREASARLPFVPVELVSGPGTYGTDADERGPSPLPGAREAERREKDGVTFQLDKQHPVEAGGKETPSWTA